MNKQIFIIGGGILAVLVLIVIGFSLGSASSGQMLPVDQWPIVAGVNDTYAENNEPPIQEDVDAIVVNGRTLSQEEMNAILSPDVNPEDVYGYYWYDNMSGLYGSIGREPLGVLPAGLGFPPLAIDASGGTTGVIVNGREITDVELAYIEAVIASDVIPGRYWLDSQANYGAEGSLVPLGSLAGSGSAGGNGSGDNFWSAGNYSAGNYNDQGQGYVSVPGYGAYGYGF